METAAQKATAQEGTNVNGLELNIVNIDSISVPNHHPRSEYGDLNDLQGSLRRDGQQDPLLVYDIGEGNFGVIDGARRLAAAKEMGWKQVTCLIKRGVSHSEAAHLSYLKNVERKTFNVIEIARHILTMRDTFGFTLDELELKGYGSTASISNKLKLLDASEKVQRQIQEGKLTAGHGLELIKLTDKGEQEKMAKKIVDHDLTVRLTRDRIDRFLAKKRKKQKAKTKVIIPAGEIPGIYFKDARDMSELPDKCIHLVCSSPPYHVGMEFEVGETFKEHLANIGGVMDETARVLVPGGIIALNVADIVDYKGDKGASAQAQIQLMAHRYQGFLKKHGVFLTDVIIWRKRPGWSKDRNHTYRADTPHTSYRIYDNWEPIYIFRKKGEREVPSEEIALKSRLSREQWIAYVDGVWAIEPNRSSYHGHPCTYPDELVKRLVQMFSYVGDTVLDPFLGSGTTVKVARELNREGIGYEREEQYKTTIMKKLGHLDASGEGESMATYAKRQLSPEEAEREAIVARAERFDSLPVPDLPSRPAEEVQEAEESAMPV